MSRRPGPGSEVVTQDALIALLTERFGPDPRAWAFVCPACGDVATAADFRAALDQAGRPDEPASNHLGQVCIGRILGVLEREQPKGGYQGRGCDWCAFGLFAGPVWIEVPGVDGGEPSFIPAFRVAEAVTA